MKKNMGNLDRILRVLVALVGIILYFTKMISGTTAIVLLILAAVFILTSLISYCPLYSIFGISTKKKES